MNILGLVPMWTFVIILDTQSPLGIIYFLTAFRNAGRTNLSISLSLTSIGQNYNFQKYRTNFLNERYDYNSIMHYRNDEFSRNGRWTIQSKQNPQMKLGNTRFSETDVRAINKLYNCGTNPFTAGKMHTVEPSWWEKVSVLKKCPSYRCHLS